MDSVAERAGGQARELTGVAIGEGYDDSFWCEVGEAGERIGGEGRLGLLAVGDEGRTGLLEALDGVAEGGFIRARSSCSRVEWPDWNEAMVWSREAGRGMLPMGSVCMRESLVGIGGVGIHRKVEWGRFVSSCVGRSSAVQFTNRERCTRE